MGYTTEFRGSFQLDRKLDAAHELYLRAFAYTRRMKRNPSLIFDEYDPIRVAAGLPKGEDGQYYVGESYLERDVEGKASSTMFGQAKEDSIVNYNNPPKGQPSLWCQWVPSEDAEAIEWDGNEKFYSYVAWLEYLISHFLKPWGYELNGSVRYQGEEMTDSGIIYCVGNTVVAFDTNSWDAHRKMEEIQKRWMQSQKLNG